MGMEFPIYLTMMTTATADLNEEACGSDSKLGSDVPADMDGDGECDAKTST